MAESSEYITVYEASGHLAGEIIRLLLEANEIPTMVLQESAGMTLGITIGRLGAAKILVPPERVQEARELIQAMEEGRLDRTFYPGKMTVKPVYKSNKWRREESLKE